MRANKPKKMHPEMTMGANWAKGHRCCTTVGVVLREMGGGADICISVFSVGMALHCGRDGRIKGDSTEVPRASLGAATHVYNCPKTGCYRSTVLTFVICVLIWYLPAAG